MREENPARMTNGLLSVYGLSVGLPVCLLACLLAYLSGGGRGSGGGGGRIAPGSGCIACQACPIVL